MGDNLTQNVNSKAGERIKIFNVTLPVTQGQVLGLYLLPHGATIAGNNSKVVPTHCHYTPPSTTTTT